MRQRAPAHKCKDFMGGNGRTKRRQELSGPCCPGRLKTVGVLHRCHLCHRELHRPSPHALHRPGARMLSRMARYAPRYHAVYRSSGGSSGRSLRPSPRPMYCIGRAKASQHSQDFAHCHVTPAHQTFLMAIRSTGESTLARKIYGNRQGYAHLPVRRLIVVETALAQESNPISG